MNPRFRKVCVLAAALLGVLSGCKSLPRYYNVGVDAISAPDVGSGTSYILVARNNGTYRDPDLQRIAVACIKAALQGRGLYEAPSNSRPDLILEIDYGRGNAILLGPNGTTQEIYLSISARANPGEFATARGPELWNVRASILDENSRAIVIMPVLAAVAADHAGAETRVKQEFRVSDQSPSVAQVNATLGFDKIEK